MRTYKGESLNTKAMYYDYFFKGQMHWVQGELYYNKEKKRFEHTHFGPRGGKYLIIWKYEI
jgi:hypothetical protein